MKIYFDVKNQIITRTDRNQVIANSADYLEAEITFSAEWATMEKTMTFKNGNLLYTYVLVNDKILEENHLNLGVGTWKVSIQGVNEDKKIVTNECNLAVNASGWIGSEALPPESIWNQLLVIIQSLHTEVASTAAIRSAVQKYIEDNYDALVKEAVIVDDVRAALDDMAEDGTLSDLLAPLVAAGMPEVVADQISAVVATQIGGVVANQIGAVVASQITTPVNQAVKNYCDDNFSGWSGALDRGLAQPLMAAPADMVGEIKSALNELEDVPQSIISLSSDDYCDMTTGADGTLTIDSTTAFTFDNDTNVNQNYGFVFDTEIGKTYVLSFTYARQGTGTPLFHIMNNYAYPNKPSLDSADYRLASLENASTPGDYSMEFTATGLQTTFNVYTYTGVTQLKVSKISCIDKNAHTQIKPSVLPFATKGTLGAIKVGDGLQIDDGVLSVSQNENGLVLVPQSYFISQKVIATTSTFGSPIALATYTWRRLCIFDIPYGAKGAYVCGADSATYARYAVVDADDEVLAIASNGIESSTTTGYYVSFPENSAKLYVMINNQDEYASCFFDYGNYRINGGTWEGMTFDTSVNTGEVYKGHSAKAIGFTTASNEHEITFDSAKSARFVGFFLKVESYNKSNKINKLTIQLYKDSTATSNAFDYVGQAFQMENWIYVKVNTAQKEFNKVKFTVTFKQTETDAVYIQVLDSALLNQFNRPIYTINFDGAWQQSEDCGAYDLLINNAVPFSITGNLNYAESKLHDAYDKGILDVGTYSYEDSDAPVAGLTNLAELNTRLKNRIQAKLQMGYNPFVFVGGGHILEPATVRVAKENGYYCFRGGEGNAYSSVETDGAIMYFALLVNYALFFGSTGMFFTHGISTNPSAEETPSLFTSISDFTAIVNNLIALRTADAIDIMNMKEFAEFRKKYDLM